MLTVGHEATSAVIEALKAHVKQHLAVHAYPRMIEIVKELPRTATGKVLKRDLRAN